MALALLAGVVQSHATQTVRELWDGSGKTSLGGHGTDSSSVGLDNSTTWAVSPPGNTTLTWDSTWNIDGFGIDGNTALPPSAGSGGTFAYYSGGNMSSLINPATTLPYGDYYSQCYARRPLNTNAYINFKADGTYYFSVRMFKNISWYGWNGDNMGGIGFASSSAANAHIVGIGTTRNSFSMEDSTDVSSTDYITTGTLDQAGVSSHPDDSGGVYYPRAGGAANLLGDLAIFMVGKLTTTASGASTLSVKAYPAWNSYPSDPSSITWDATYNFTETNIMTQLLVWQYGNGPSVQDALRVGTTWADAMGLELIGAIKATPGSTVYAGTTVTLSQSAALNTGTYPMTFQWYSNSVPLTDMTNSTLVLTTPTTDFTADYSIVAANFFGSLTNVLHVTINPAVPPFFTALPASITRSVNGTATFTVGVDGTPPFGLQLKHSGTNLPGVATQLAGPGTATLQYGPLTLASAGQYSVTATNLFGTTNCQSATLTVFAPASGSFQAAAAAAGAAAFWRLSETTNSDLTANGVLLHEYMSGLDGNAPDTNNMIFGLAGPNFPGFAGLTSIQVQNNGLSSQINLGGMKQYSNTMTMLFWMNASYLSGNALMLDTGTAQGNGLGDGPYYGIDYHNGSVGSQWGTGDSIWNSGITLPLNQWVMVALVVEPNETTVYAGTDPFTLQSVTRSSIVGTNYSNISGSLPNGRLALGRTDYAWAQYNNSWADHVAQFNDAAVFNTALTPSAITNLFLSGVGLTVGATPDGGGNLSLNWLPVLTLQQATSVTGPWTDVGGSPTPPYSVPMTSAQKFYRVRN